MHDGCRRRNGGFGISWAVRAWFYRLMLPQFSANYWQLALEPAPLIEPLALIKPRALIKPSNLIEPRGLIEAGGLVEPGDAPLAPSWIAPHRIPLTSGPKPRLS